MQMKEPSIVTCKIGYLYSLHLENTGFIMLKIVQKSFFLKKNTVHCIHTKAILTI